MEPLSIVFYLLLTLALLQTLLSLARGNRTCRKLPPGPAALPVVSNLLKLGTSPTRNRLDANQYLRRQKVEELISYVAKCCQEGVAVDIGRVAFTTFLNLLSNTLFSVDLADPSHDSSKEFKELVSNIMEEAQLRKLGKAREGNDVLDVLLDIDEQNNEEIDRIHIEHLFLDLFAAGTDTTSNTVEWAMAELLQNPETLKKAKAELEQTIGKGKLVEESDISRLPYLQAIVKETSRIHPPVPFLIPRKVETDVEVCGYIVPQGAQVLVNAWAIGRDPSIWPYPTSFMPERFLGSEIDVRSQDFELIIRMVPMMLGSFINSFDWKLEGVIAPRDLDMEEKVGITLQKVQKAQPLRAVPINV
ncbi:hypothetical protein TEA_005650 [Camellia sinensis var. sinensis]|uniref:Uncharacterized protein n=1 Tax=Camellia sinensis var. sinensis TaxID=542762 RepID=A0A4S4E5E8_CAMSN|nr:hypothetical protein TEA_005650 [Camellia sinensis var. sinensis]